MGINTNETPALPNPLKLSEVTYEFAEDLTSEEIKHFTRKFLDELGIEFKAEFVPQSQSRNAGKKPILNWDCKFLKSGRFQLDYSQGIGHIPHMQNHWGDSSGHKGAYEKLVAENGKYTVGFSKFTNGKVDWFRAADRLANFGKRLPPPHVADLIYCIVSEYNSLDYATYEDWCEEYGYEPDSREGERIYQLCLKQSLEARAMFGEFNIQQFQILLSQY